MYKSGWIVSNSVPTAIKTWGSWINEEFEADSMILLITGNPGITDFYKKFLSTLYELVNIPVWVICHAGNQVPPASENLSFPALNSNPDLYSLEGQIKHKKDFITTYIPKSKNIYLIGHSVGAKICVELMKEPDIAERVKQIHLICPTLQYIGDTPNGKVFQQFLSKLTLFLISLAWIFTFLPFKIRAFFVQGFLCFYSFSFKTEPCCVSGLLKLFSPKVLKYIFFLANDEMAKIKELDGEVYEKNCNKIYAYYGQSDRWAPLYQYEDLKKKYPNINCQLLDSSVSHSFVFKSSETAAAKLAQEIKRTVK